MDNRNRGESGGKKQKKMPKVAISPELTKLFDEHLKKSFEFAKEFTKLAGLRGEKAEKIENIILGQCAESISLANLVAANALDLS